MKHRASLLFYLALILVGAYRIWLCTQSPSASGDIVRSLVCGYMVLEKGITSLGIPISQTYPDFAGLIPWGDHPFNYPPLLVLCWALFASIHPSIFAFKLLLTIIEGFNSYLIWKITRNTLFTLIYWTLPCSLFWVSKEGQSEPIQNFFILLSLATIRTHPSLAGLLFSISIQTKLSGLFFGPYLIYKLYKKEELPQTLRFTIWGLVGFIPSLVFAIEYPLLQQISSTFNWPYSYNPYHWACWNHNTWWVRGTLLYYLQTVNYLIIIVIAWNLRRNTKLLMAGTSLFLFFLASRFMGIFQWWYFLLALPALVPLFLEEEISRPALWLLVALCILVEPVSTRMLFPKKWGPQGQGTSADIYLPITEALNKLAKEKQATACAKSFSP